MSHESTDRHRARVGSATGTAFVALLFGWFPVNELLYLAFGHETEARMTGIEPTGKGYRRRVLYTYRDPAGQEHADSGLMYRTPLTAYGNTPLRVEYHTLPWPSSRPAGVDWFGLAMFAVAAVAAAGLLAWNWRDVQQFWRRERDMAGF